MRFNLENAQGENYMAQPQVDDYLNEQITQALLGNKEPEPHSKMPTPTSSNASTKTSA